MCPAFLHQDITLHRSLGTRLGITLGFDQSKKDTSLYVMDVSGRGPWAPSAIVFTLFPSLQLLEEGIAKRDGRLQVGDVVQKVGQPVCLSVCLCGVTPLDVNNRGMLCAATLAYLWVGLSRVHVSSGCILSAKAGCQGGLECALHKHTVHVVAYLSSRGLLQAVYLMGLQSCDKCSKQRPSTCGPLPTSLRALSSLHFADQWV